MNSSSDSLEPDADLEELARSIALRLLTVRARTRGELSEALRRRNVPAEAAEVVLTRLAEVGLIDDEEFARTWVNSRQQRRHLSRTVLRQELRGKGVAVDHIDSAVAAVSTDDELTAAKSLAEKKVRSMRALAVPVQRRRLAAALARRGFAADVVASVLRDLDLEGQNEADVV